MLKRSFFGLMKPRIHYALVGGTPRAPQQLPQPSRVTLFIKSAHTHKNTLLKTGDLVKAGQRLSLEADGAVYGIAPIAGSIAGLAPYLGDYGEAWTAVTIEAAAEQEADTAFGEVAATPTLAHARRFLAHIPGAPCLDCLQDAGQSDFGPIHTIVIGGLDADILVTTRQHLVKTASEAIHDGIACLKQLSGVTKVVLVVARESLQNYGDLGATVKAVESEYPAGLPHLIARDVLGQVIPAGQTLAQAGIAFFSVEAVIALGRAFAEGVISQAKLLTVIRKDGTRKLVSATLGTPVGDILEACGVTVQDRDRIIVGGPMAGKAIFDLAQPVCADTDALMVQAAADIPDYVDYPCINCGECIRMCPVRIPVNMLVRLLEAGFYQQAVDEYDLDCCIECGLCAFVCVAQIPIFQYIKLARYELERMKQAEATHD